MAGDFSHKANAKGASEHITAKDIALFEMVFQLKLEMMIRKKIFSAG